MVNVEAGSAEVNEKYHKTERDQTSTVPASTTVAVLSSPQTRNRGLREDETVYCGMSFNL
jgi:hypothetical protein